LVAVTNETCPESPAMNRRLSPKEKPAKSTTLGRVSSRLLSAALATSGTVVAGAAKSAVAAAARAARRREDAT
jgi:hypothetical protein